MCGIAGILDFGRATAHDDLGTRALRMADALEHRGPDARGCWIDERCGVALAHRRLAIIDLSPAGQQPMASADGRHVIVFNGEIYNFQQLRLELRDRYPFRGHCDTEVLLAAIAVWGLDHALQRIEGMYAFALWEVPTRRLHLVRDRLGEKPLYYGLFGSTLLFASQIDAFRQHPSFVPRISRGALSLYFRHTYVPGPYSIFEGVRKLPPGTILTFSTDSRPTRTEQPRTYWSYLDAARAGVKNPCGEEEATERLEVLLRRAVRLRMEADVPLGAFLSGGLDSSLVVALMQAESTQPVRTFTVGVESASHNEAPQARRVAEYLGTAHTELTVTPADALACIPRLAHIYDEPFADPSQLPTLLIAQAARRHVTVALSGDGGDEVFGGYNRYIFGPTVWRRLRHVPVPVRRLGARALLRLTPATWDQVAHNLANLLPAAGAQRNIGDKLHKVAALLAAGDADEVYRILASTWQAPGALVIGGTEPPTPLSSDVATAVSDDPLDRMMLLDGLTTLPEDMLTKVDRASMAVSLEVRVPLLDHHLVEFAWRLPRHLKLAGQQGKVALRKIAYEYVPRELLDRPKMGFDPPLAEWLRGPLREWADCLLASDAINREGLLDATLVRSVWEEHLSGRRNRDYQLWSVLMFRSWMESL